MYPKIIWQNKNSCLLLKHKFTVFLVYFKKQAPIIKKASSFTYSNVLWKNYYSSMKDFQRKSFTVIGTILLPFTDNICHRSRPEVQNIFFPRLRRYRQMHQLHIPTKYCILWLSKLDQLYSIFFSTDGFLGHKHTHAT